METLNFITAPDGSVGIHSGELRKLMMGIEPDSILWVSGQADAREPEREMPAILSFADDQVRVDLESRDLFVDGVVMPTTPKEFDILSALCQKAGKVLTREQLLVAVCGGSDWYEKRVVDVYVSSLRGKMGDHRGILKTRRGIGYLIDDRREP